MDQRAILDHQFTVAAYAITWAIQLGYVAWLAFRWRAQRRAGVQPHTRKLDGQRYGLFQVRGIHQYFAPRLCKNQRNH